MFSLLLLLLLQGVLAKAVLNNAQPTDQEVRTQGTNKTVVGPLQTDAQRQAARSGRDKETAAAAAGGKRRSGKQTGGVGSMGGHGRGNTAKQKGGSNCLLYTSRLRRCVAQVSSDSDEDSDAVCLEDDLGSESDASDLGEGTAAAAAAGGEGGHNYEGVAAAAAAGRRANKPPRWRELGY